MGLAGLITVLKSLLLAYPNFKEIRKDEIFEGDNWRVRWGWKRDGLGNTTAKNTADKGYWTRIVFLSGKLIFDGKELGFVILICLFTKKVYL
jgi:hypothetical protein